MCHQLSFAFINRHISTGITRAVTKGRKATSVKSSVHDEGRMKSGYWTK